MTSDNFSGHIRYQFTTEPSPLRTAHGVWGGVNPQGEIEMCFYDESSIPPQFSEQSIGPDGTPGPEHFNSDGGTRKINRNIHSRILLNYQSAKAILQWLEERVNELESADNPEMYDPASGIRQ